MSVRLERRAGDRHVVSIEIPEETQPFIVAAAASKLRRVADVLADVEASSCPVCYAHEGMWHDGNCPQAPNDQIEVARKAAIAEGMRP